MPMVDSGEKLVLEPTINKQNKIYKGYVCFSYRAFCIIMRLEELGINRYDRREEVRRCLSCRILRILRNLQVFL